MYQSDAILIESDFHRAIELRQALQQTLDTKMGNITLELRTQSTPFRLDPTVLAAIITGGASVLAALVPELFKFFKPSEVAVGVVRITDSSGAVLEMSADTPPEKVKALSEQVREHKITHIMLAHK